MVDKVARSDDPKQQALRDLKKQWQKEMKIFIAQNIALKRGIGGVGDPKAGIPASKIKDPLPPEVPIYIDEMVTRFNNLVNMAKHIVSDQDDYSKNRRKGKTEASYEFQIFKEASNEFTRFISRLRHGLWFSSDEGAKEKIRLMSSLAEFEDQINEIEYLLASNDDRSVSQSFFEFIKFLGLFRNRFVRRLSNEINRQSVEFKQKGDYLEEDVDITTPVTLPSKSFQDVLNELKDEREDSLKEDLKLEENENNLEENNINITPKTDSSTDLDNITLIISKINSLSELGLSKLSKLNDADINKILSKTKQAQINIDDPKYYNELLNIIKGYLNGSDINVSSSNSFGEILGKLMKITSSSLVEDGIKKIAKLRFKRWQRRLMLSFKQDEESQSRLDTVKKLRDLGKYMNSILSLLEGKDTKIGEVMIVVSKMYEYISDICYDFASMANDHNASYGAERASGNKTTLIPINKGDINTMVQQHNFYKEQSASLKNGSITNEVK
jgi:hypothetical protein